MTTLLTFALALPWLLISFGGWLGYQLIRQNGRALLRLEALEQGLKALQAEPPPTVRARACHFSRPDALRHAPFLGPSRESPQSQNHHPGVPSPRAFVRGSDRPGAASLV